MPAILREEPATVPVGGYLRGGPYSVRRKQGRRGGLRASPGCGGSSACSIARSPRAVCRIGAANSACSSASQGGNLGQITADQTTPEFEQALFALEPGSIAPKPVATRYGFHVIRLDRKHEGRELPFELVADRIAEYLQESVQRRALAQYIARLATAAKIEGVDLASAEAMRVN